MKRGLKWIAPLVVAIVGGLAVWLVVSRWAEIVAFPWRLRPGWLAGAVLGHALALGVTWVVWHQMIARLGGFKQLAQSFRIYYVSTLAKRVPTSLPYIGGRVVMYGQVGVPASAVLNAIVLENLLFALAGLVVLLGVLSLDASGASWWPAAASGGAAVLGVLVWRPQVFVEGTNIILRRLGRRSLDQAPARGDILSWVGTYTLAWLSAGWALYCVTRAFTDAPAPGGLDTLRISTVTVLISMLSIILPGGFGLKEAASGVLFTPWMPFATAVLISLAYRLMQTVDEIIWVLLAAAFVPASPDDHSTAWKRLKSFFRR